MCRSVRLRPRWLGGTTPPSCHGHDIDEPERGIRQRSSSVGNFGRRERSFFQHHLVEALNRRLGKEGCRGPALDHTGGGFVPVLHRFSLIAYGLAQASHKEG